MLVGKANLALSRGIQQKTVVVSKHFPHFVHVVVLVVHALYSTVNPAHMIENSLCDRDGHT